MTNVFTAVVNLGADPEVITLGTREVYKLRLADRGIGKKAVTRWFTGLFSGPDLNTCKRLVKGDQIMVSGSLNQTEYKPKQPKFKGQTINGDEMPFGKILQVLKSDTFFNTSVGDFPADDATTKPAEVTEGDFPVETGSELEGL